MQRTHRCYTRQYLRSYLTPLRMSQPKFRFLQILKGWVPLIEKKNSRNRSVSCCGRVVKALDLKSNGVSPRRFKSCRQRSFFLFHNQQILLNYFFIDFYYWEWVKSENLGAMYRLPHSLLRIKKINLKISPTHIFISQFSANVSKNEIIKSWFNKSWYVKWYPSDEKLIPSGVRVGDRLSPGVKTGKTQIKLLFDFDEKISKFLFWIFTEFLYPWPSVPRTRAGNPKLGPVIKNVWVSSGHCPHWWVSTLIY